MARLAGRRMQAKFFDSRCTASLGKVPSWQVHAGSWLGLRGGVSKLAKAKAVPNEEARGGSDLTKVQKSATSGFQGARGSARGAEVFLGLCFL